MRACATLFCALVGVFGLVLVEIEARATAHSSVPVREQKQSDLASVWSVESKRSDEKRSRFTSKDLKTKTLKNADGPNELHAPRSVNMVSIDPECATAVQHITESDVWKHTCKFPEYNYPNGLVTRWQIQAPSGKKIQLIFGIFNVEGHPLCQYDVVRIYNGDSEDSGSLIGGYCGEDLLSEDAPDEIVSTGNKLRIVFTTDDSVSYAGFQFKAHFLAHGETPVWPAVAAATACNDGHIVSDDGYISSPGYPSNYRDYTECVYKLEVSTGYLKLEFDNFDVEECGNNCGCDSVKIYPDFESTMPSHIFCGDAIPEDIVSMTNKLKVVFTTDYNTVRKGFEAMFITVADNPRASPFMLGNGMCGGTMTGPAGVVHSPNYHVGGNYFDYQECDWLIESETNECIKLDFLAMDIEECGDNCGCDRLLVYSGVDATSPSYILCGTSIPDEIIVGPTAKLLFQSDGSVTLPGFEALWFTDNACPQNLPPPIRTCGAVMDTEVGTIQTPGFADGDDYGDYLTCEWHLHFPPQTHPMKILLQFTDFDVECCWACECDRVEIFESIEATEQMDTLCGEVPPSPIFLDGPSAKIRFISDYSVAMPGFKATWEPFNAHCSGTLNADGQSPVIVESLGYDRNMNYTDHAVCDWTVTTPGPRVKIDLLDLDMENCGNVTCVCDRLEIYEGPDSLLPEHVYCGRPPTPITLIIPNPSVRIRFVSDYSITAKGFHAEVSGTDESYVPYNHQLCTDVFDTPIGHLSSPREGNEYRNDTECVWLINPFPPGLDGKFIELTFNSFSLERCGDICGCDKVEIYDHRDDMVPLITLCGGMHNIPPTIVSHSNMMKIRFVTDYSITDLGFDASWAITTTQPPPGPPEPPKCIHHAMAAPGGAFMSINYDQPYPDDLDCEYIIEAPPNKGISLYFEDFQLEYCGDCSCDSLRVVPFDITVPNSPGQIDTSSISGGFRPFCANSIPHSMNFTSNGVLLKFVTDYSVAERGFVVVFEVY